MSLLPARKHFLWRTADRSEPLTVTFNSVGISHHTCCLHVCGWRLGQLLKHTWQFILCAARYIEIKKIPCRVWQTDRTCSSRIAVGCCSPISPLLKQSVHTPGHRSCHCCSSLVSFLNSWSVCLCVCVWWPL